MFCQDESEDEREPTIEEVDEIEEDLVPAMDSMSFDKDRPGRLLAPTDTIVLEFAPAAERKGEGHDEQGEPNYRSLFKQFLSLLCRGLASSGTFTAMRLLTGFGRICWCEMIVLSIVFVFVFWQAHQCGAFIQKNIHPFFTIYTFTHTRTLLLELHVAVSSCHYTQNA